MDKLELLQPVKFIMTEQVQGSVQSILNDLSADEHGNKINLINISLANVKLQQAECLCIFFSETRVVW